MNHILCRGIIAGMAFCATPGLWCADGPGAVIQSRAMRIEFDPLLRSRVIACLPGKEVPLGPFSGAEKLEGEKETWSEFPLKKQKTERIEDAFGKGEQLQLEGEITDVKKILTVRVYDEFPAFAVFNVKYINQGSVPLKIKAWTNHAYRLATQSAMKGPAFWSYQSGAYPKRPNWLLPLGAGFHQENYLGMNAADYGGGTPILDVWSREAGMGLGHLESVPEPVSLPVRTTDAAHAQVGIRLDRAVTIQPGGELKTLHTFVSVHEGDYFSTLTGYRRLMEKQGFKMAQAPESAFGPIWCAWGYGRTMQPRQIYESLPTVKKLGFTWVTVDDGWQNNYADWLLDHKKFPGGDSDMKKLVDRIHADGFLAQVWWAPFMGSQESKLLKDHPEYALLNRDGSRCKISWWPTFYLCPAQPGVVEYCQGIAKKMIAEWGYDGVKLDGQYMNSVPPCYNPAHHHEHPEDSTKALPGLIKAISEAVRAIKPKALVEFCPCGTSYSFFTMPHYNMSVAADPESSFQIRSKGKTLKGLMGDGVAFFGDHVELSDGANDFASTIGVGGVVGTQFVLPSLVKKRSKSDLTPSREKDMAKWLGIYEKYMLPKGEYLGGLYDIGFDKPETHAIRKGTSMFFAFYAKTWKGPIELRGLEKRSYAIKDYEHGLDLGTVEGPRATLPASFQKHLLIEVVPR